MATYQAAAGDILVPGAASVTELGTTVGGFIASCGFAALAAVQHVLQGTPATAAQDTLLTEQAVTEHQTVGAKAGSGQATPENVKYVAMQHGINFLDITQQQAEEVAGIAPVEIGVSNATVFGGWDSNVSGHYITALGRTASGSLIVSDPNQPESEQGGLNVYTPQQISAAQPFWFGVPSANSSGGGVTTGAASRLVTSPGGIGTPTTGGTMPAGLVSDAGGLSIPGIGTIWSAAQGAWNGATGALSNLNPLNDLASTIDKDFQSAVAGVFTFLKRAGVFILGLALVALGALVILRRPVAQAANVYSQGAAAHAASAAQP